MKLKRKRKEKEKNSPFPGLAVTKVVGLRCAPSAVTPAFSYIHIICINFLGREAIERQGQVAYLFRDPVNITRERKKMRVLECVSVGGATVGDRSEDG